MASAICCLARGLESPMIGEEPFIQKPFRKSALAETVKTILAEEAT